jgi:hypothetical protein
MCVHQIKSFLLLLQINLFIVLLSFSETRRVLFALVRIVWLEIIEVLVCNFLNQVKYDRLSQILQLALSVLSKFK